MSQPTRQFIIAAIGLIGCCLVLGPADGIDGAIAASPGEELPPAIDVAEGTAPDATLDEQISEGGYVEGRLLVGFRDDVSDDEKSELHARFGGQVVRDIPSIGVQVLRFDDDADTIALVSAYQSQEEVGFAEPDYVAEILGSPDPQQPAWLSAAEPHGADPLGLALTPNDEYYSRQWHHARIDSAGAWDHALATGVTIAIIDTGVNCDHRDLRDQCVAGYDFVFNDADPDDDNGHGTHVAGIAAATTNNAVGVAATGWGARIMPMKALNQSGNGSHSSIANSVTWATDRGAQVINMSLGGLFTSSTLRRAVEYAIQRDAVVVAAAGNQGVSNPSYPAAYNDVLGIAATTQSDQRANFSNYGNYIDLAAPGVGILSTIANGGYMAFNGTSMASPVVAGVAALLVAQNPSRTPQQVETILEQTADDLGDPGWDPLFGWGRINAGRALAQQPGTVTPPTATPGVPTREPAATPTLSVDPVLQVEELINLERAAVGLPPLYTHPALRQASARHSDDMGRNSFCSHDGSDGSTAYERMREAGYPDPFSEIVACGQTEPAIAVATWMNSPLHRAIILCTSCTEMGAGYRFINRGSRHYWTVTFGRRPASGPLPTLAPTDGPPPLPTQGPSSTPVTPSPTPAVPADHTLVRINPDNNRVGWVVSSQPSLNHFDDEDTYSGTWNGRIYHGAAQFDLDVIPLDATIHAARLELTGRSREFLGSVGTWSVNILRTEIDDTFPNEGYTGIHNAPLDSTLLPLLGTADLDEGKVNTFVLDDAQLDILSARRSGSGHLTIRMDGPTSGSFSNLFTWDTGYGPETEYPGPALVVEYRDDGDSIPSPTATQTPLPTEPPTAVPPATDEPPSPTPALATATPPPPPASATPTETLPPPPPTSAPSDQPIVIVPEREDVGYVRQFEPFNHLGDDNMFTGYYQTRIYHGAAQFSLEAIPPGSAIRSATLKLTGQSLRYLSSAGNGLWEVKILAASEDSGWRSSTFSSLHSAQISSALTPQLGQADFDVGHVNEFVLTPFQLRELEFRASTTRRVSFRLDGPSGGFSNVMDWDSGYGAGQRNPPQLEIVVGPPGSGEPVPTKSPEDQQRVTDVIREINRVRAENGLDALEVSSQLSRAAALHNADMVRNRFFNHTGSDGSSPEQRVAREGFDAVKVREVLAAANGNPETVVQAWLAQGQRDELLDPDLTHIGAHYMFSTSAAYQHYWTVKMAQRR